MAYRTWEKDEETRIVLSRDFAQMVSDGATNKNKSNRRIHFKIKKKNPDVVTFGHI